MLREREVKREALDRDRRKDAERSSPKDAGPREVEEQLQRAMREMQEQTHRALRETHEQMAKLARSVEELREQVGRQRAEGERRKD